MEDSCSGRQEVGEEPNDANDSLDASGGVTPGSAAKAKPVKRAFIEKYGVAPVVMVATVSRRAR